MSNPITITVNNLELRRRNRIVIKNISFKLHSGEFIAIIGPNGAGKSTLLAALAGLRPLGGQSPALMLGEQPITSYTKGQLARLVGFLPAYTSVPFPLTVEELLAQANGSSTAQAQALAVMELEALRHVPLTRLSTGEARRAWLAMVLSRHTPVLLLDEPLAGLDPRYQVRLLEELRQRVVAGVLVAFIAHDLPYASRADRVLAIGPDGCLVADGPPKAVLTQQQLRQLYGVEVWLGNTGEDWVYPVATRAL
jgi:iron complex transport system ATP-binding protein